MRLHRGTVDHRDLRRVSAGDEGREDALPQPALAPAVPAIEDRGVWPVFRRQGAPAAAFTQPVDDAADHPTIVHAPRPSVDHRQMRRDRCPLHVIQPEQARHGSPSAVWQGESPHRLHVNWVQTLTRWWRRPTSPGRFGQLWHKAMPAALIFGVPIRQITPAAGSPFSAGGRRTAGMFRQYAARAPRWSPPIWLPASPRRPTAMQCLGCEHFA